MPIILDEHQNQPANNFNNQRHNPSLLNHWEILIIVIYVNISLLLAIFMVPTNEILVIFLVVIIHGICLPSFFYYFNVKLRQFYQRQFWENAPNFLQPFNPDRIIEINIPDNNIELGPLPHNRYSKKNHVRARRPQKNRAHF